MAMCGQTYARAAPQPAYVAKCGQTYAPAGPPAPQPPSIASADRRSLGPAPQPAYFTMCGQTYAPPRRQAAASVRGQPVQGLALQRLPPLDSGSDGLDLRLGQGGRLARDHPVHVDRTADAR